MLRRIVSALVLVPLTLGLVLFAPAALYLAALGVVGSLCLHEYFQMMRKIGLGGQPWFGHAGFWFLLIGFQTSIPATLWSVLALLAAFLVAMGQKDPIRDRVLGLAANLLGVFYVALCLHSAYAVRFDFGGKAGRDWTLLLLVVIWVGDTAALFIGRRFGRTPFASRLSPKKTNEGAVGGLLAGMLAALLLHFFVFKDIPLDQAVAASLLIGVFGQLGDLAESMLKRAAEVKESSYLIPGHGGVLDRVDSLLFAFPVLFFYLHLVS